MKSEYTMKANKIINHLNLIDKKIIRVKYDEIKEERNNANKYINDVLNSNEKVHMDIFHINGFVQDEYDSINICVSFEDTNFILTPKQYSLLVNISGVDVDAVLSKMI